MDAPVKSAAPRLLLGDYSAVTTARHSAGSALSVKGGASFGGLALGLGLGFFFGAGTKGLDGVVGPTASCAGPDGSGCFLLPAINQVPSPITSTIAQAASAPRLAGQMLSRPAPTAMMMKRMLDHHSHSYYYSLKKEKEEKKRKTLQ